MPASEQARLVSALATKNKHPSNNIQSNRTLSSYGPASPTTPKAVLVMERGRAGAAAMPTSLTAVSTPTRSSSANAGGWTTRHT